MELDHPRCYTHSASVGGFPSEGGAGGMAKQGGCKAGQWTENGCP